MNRLIVQLFSLVLFFGNVNGQVHSQGLNAIDLTGSKTAIGFMASGAINHNFSDAAYYKLKLNGEFGRLYNIRYSAYTGDITIFYNPFYISDFIQFNVGAGPTISWESLGGVTKDKKLTNFSFGGKASADLEIFLADQVAFLISASQSAFVTRKYGQFRYDAGIGLRIFLNNYR